ncbi:hypothetical protein [Saccharothrix texasensis]|uniref:Uncharacterized protein n=1 Tax=Saccharothrix texasensis TaxID=103734 RepID=A0A3N1H5J7_9PSEU|nr:hypothetical protein [Saccharothrix texasensis]ROP37810.1 hypothetical protein EDD40_3136 [Saccharothrix texasensis]
MWVLPPRCEQLFSPEVREQAERKLRLLDVDVDVERARLVRRLPRPA